VVYNGVDNGIHELWFDRTGWHRRSDGRHRRTVAAGAALTGYAEEAQHTQHVMYTAP
jgi:hypothetical protein